VHVWDLAQAHILGVNYMLDDYPQPGAYVLNLGTREGISNKQIVDYVFKRYGLPFVNYGPRRDGDPDALVADATQAKNLLNWVPKYSNIETIIDSAHKWYTK
jgi:UDP-glucose 4-epimerase